MTKKEIIEFFKEDFSKLTIKEMKQPRGVWKIHRIHNLRGRDGITKRIHMVIEFTEVKDRF